MISCTEFIPAYSELFKFLEARDGKEEVVRYWEYVADNYLTKLRDLVAEHGLRGCWIYWTEALTEEAADFEIVLDEEAGEYRATMYYCPSKGRLLEYEHIEPYHAYCEHCRVLYKRVLEPLGLEYEKDLSECDQAKCSTVIRVKGAAISGEGADR
jgi:hypothetical protein